MTATTLGVPLAPDHERAVMDIRRRLEQPEPVNGSWRPHVSLLVLLVTPRQPVDQILAEVAAQTAPFTVRARGIGVFTGRDPDEMVLHVPVVRGPEIEALHGELLGRALRAGAEVDGHYQPQAWFPHITLCQRNLTASRLLRGVDTLLEIAPVAWNVPVAKLARFDERGMIAGYDLAAPTG